ncbi:MAG: ion channel [Thermodesulfobacteriota bacterium]
MKKIIEFIQRENLFQILMVILIMVLVSATLVAWLEPELSFFSAIWWSIVTLTTVGYGDISPATTGGRVIAVVIMFFGIGVLGMLSASLAAMLISKRMRENRGMCKMELSDHIILCEWNYRTKAVLHELRADAKTSDMPIVLIADIEEKPLSDDNLFFVRGQVNEETLEKANLDKARTVVVLGDDNLEATSRDAKVVLTTLTIESMTENVYTVVELVDKANELHCRRAHADEIIVGSELSSHLMASATLDHGISRVVSELLSSRYGNELYSVSVPSRLVGSTFLDALVSVKKEKQATVIGVQKGRGGEVLANPDGDYQLDPEDYLVLVAKDRPQL